MQRKDDGQIFFKSQTDSVIQWFQMTLRLWETTFNDLDDLNLTLNVGKYHESGQDKRVRPNLCPRFDIESLKWTLSTLIWP